MEYRKMQVEEICKLSNLFMYNDIENMVLELKQRISNHKEDVFVIEDNLRAKSLYGTMGFNQLISHNIERSNGIGYDYDLYLRLSKF